MIRVQSTMGRARIHRHSNRSLRTWGIAALHAEVGALPGTKSSSDRSAAQALALVGLIERSHRDHATIDGVGIELFVSVDILDAMEGAPVIHQDVTDLT